MVSTELSKSSFSFNTPHCWNQFYNTLQLDVVLPLRQLQILIGKLLTNECKNICVVLYFSLFYIVSDFNSILSYE